MIRVNGLYLSFEGTYVLNDITLNFPRGSCNMIIGRSGSGKTVLLKSLAGLLEPDQGEIWYQNHCFTSMEPAERKELRKKTGMLFQGGALFDSLTVEENVRFPLDMHTSMNRSEKQKRVQFCLERVRVTKSDHLLPAALSGGMRKRVAIARAIALNPDYLFCDEPNSGLDPETGIVIDKLIKEITLEFNMTTIINSHDMNSVLEIGDKVAFIHRGCLCWEGSRDEVLNSDNEALNNFVFATSLAREIKKA